MSRLTRCVWCSGGGHEKRGDCWVSFCTCPLPQCEQSRARGDWKKHVNIMGIEIPDLDLGKLTEPGKTFRLTEQESAF